MARIVKKHDERKAEILDTAEDIFLRKGYEDASVSDIIRTSNIAKGTFYHYFSSKIDLLENILTRKVELLYASVQPIINDDGLRAVDKFNAFLKHIHAWKLSFSDVYLMTLKVMYKPENALVRQIMLRKQIEMMMPVYEAVITQGIGENLFHVENLKDTTEIVIIFLTGCKDRIAEVFLEWEPYLEDQENVKAFLNLVSGKISAYEQALSRILGAPEGSLIIIDREFLRPKAL